MSRRLVFACMCITLASISVATSSIHQTEAAWVDNEHARVSITADGPVAVSKIDCNGSLTSTTFIVTMPTGGRSTTEYRYRFARSIGSELTGSLGVAGSATSLSVALSSLTGGTFYVYPVAGTWIGAEFGVNVLSVAGIGLACTPH